MSQRRINRVKFALLVALPALLAGTVIAGTQTQVYTYDVLGRVTFVQDTKNGNRDYDYDPAGNRLNVAAGTASDASSEPLPPPVPSPPTGLSSAQSSQCSWHATWNVMANATKYTVHDWKGYHYVDSTTNSADYSFCSDASYPSDSNPYNYRPKWVIACNMRGVCSDKAYFP